MNNFCKILAIGHILDVNFKPLYLSERHDSLSPKCSPFYEAHRRPLALVEWESIQGGGTLGTELTVDAFYMQNKPIETEANIREVFDVNVCANLNSVFAAMMHEPMGRISLKYDAADGDWTVEQHMLGGCKEILMIIKCKAFWNFNEPDCRRAEVFINKYKSEAKVFDSFVAIKGDPEAIETKISHLHYFNAVNELFGCMVATDCAFGTLAVYNHTWFFYFDNASLCVSEPSGFNLPLVVNNTPTLRMFEYAIAEAELRSTYHNELKKVYFKNYRHASQDILAVVKKTASSSPSLVSSSNEASRKRSRRNEKENECCSYRLFLSDHISIRSFFN